jgi:drug/metabolite transporter (DMT)-like permease
MKVPIETMKNRQLVADISLMVVTLIWGTTFVVVKNALTDIGPMLFIGVRFLLAFVFLLLIYYKRLRQNWRVNLPIAVMLGLILFTGYALQTVGLQFTTAANSGFITGLSVVLVPLLGYWWGQGKPGIMTMVGAGSATLGLGLLTLNGTFQLNSGDLLTLISTLAFALHIVLVGYYAPRTDAVVSAIIQIGTVAVAGMVSGLWSEAVPLVFTREIGIALAVTAIPATALALVIQNTMQRYTTAARTALIFAMEPVFGGIAAYLWLNEILTIKQLVGCVFIVGGMLISELGTSGHEKAASECSEAAR